MIFVTGGTGLVGSHLLYELISKGKRVKALKRENSNLTNTLHVFSYYSNNYQKLFSKIEWIDGDITDMNSINESLAGIKEIYHCAGYVSFHPGHKQQTIEININGTRNIVNAALLNNITKFCFVSSVATTGAINNGEEITENHFLNSEHTKSIYAYSKLQAEMEVWRGIAEGLNAVIVNPSIILGPGNWTKTSSRMFKTIYDGLKFYTNGVTGYVDVKDVVQIMQLLMENDIFNERFIITSENLSFKTVFSEIAKNLNKKPPSLYASPVLSEIAWRIERIRSKLFNCEPVITKETAKSAHQISCFSNKKIKELLNYKFIPIIKSIKYYSNLFLKDIKN